MGALVRGRRTYAIFAAFWPTAPEEAAAVAEPFNRLSKCVVSTTLTKPLARHNSRLLRSEVPSGTMYD